MEQIVDEADGIHPDNAMHQNNILVVGFIGN